ncbi:hypothetical protein JB92DRAFT_2892011, partial [Gautieria morchelliformis]
AAMAVVNHLIDVHAALGILRYAPHCFFVMGGFCGAFLLCLALTLDCQHVRCGVLGLRTDEVTMTRRSRSCQCCIRCRACMSGVRFCPLSASRPVFVFFPDAVNLLYASC